MCIRWSVLPITIFERTEERAFAVKTAPQHWLFGGVHINTHSNLYMSANAATSWVSPNHFTESTNISVIFMFATCLLVTTFCTRASSADSFSHKIAFTLRFFYTSSTSSLLTRNKFDDRITKQKMGIFIVSFLRNTSTTSTKELEYRNIFKPVTINGKK